MNEQPDSGYPSLQMHSSLGVHFGVEQTRRPKFTEFMEHVGAVELYGHQRDRLMLEGDSGSLTTNWLFWGRTAAGKTSLALMFLIMAIKDAEIGRWTKRKNLPPLRVNYLPYASALKVGKEEGSIDPQKGNGAYNADEYRAGSIIHSMFVQEKNNNSEGPQLNIIEVTGPSDEFDRGFSTAQMLGKQLNRETHVFIVDRAPNLIKDIADERSRIETAVTPKDLVRILSESQMQLVSRGKQLALDTMSDKDLLELRARLISGAALSQGVIRSNHETDKYRDSLKVDNDRDMWIATMRKIGFGGHQYDILRNPPSKKRISMHDDLRRNYDPIHRYAEFLQALKRGEKVSYPRP